MQQISNKTLTILLLIAIVISVTGTIISISRINQIILQTYTITAMATSTGTGMVNVTIAAVTSITATDNVIHFGSCSPNTTYGTNLSSNSSEDSWGVPGVCTGASSPDNLTIKNDGNKNVNVTVQTPTLARTFIGGTVGGAGQAEMWFAVRNASSTPGCFNTSNTFVAPSEFNGSTGMQFHWKNFSVINTEYLACANLTFGSSANSLSLFIKLFVPANAPTTPRAAVNLTFTGTSW